MPKQFKDIKIQDNGDRWEDKLPFKMTDIRENFAGDYQGLRLVGYVEPFARFWVPTEASKAHNPYKLRAKMYPAISVDFDPEEEIFTGDKCLYRKARFSYEDDDGNAKEGKLKQNINYLIFFINRERQEERTGISLKKKCTKLGMSDIQCATVPPAFVGQVSNAMDMHAKKTGKNIDPTDPDDGVDLFFKFDKTANAEAKYNIALGDPTPLTDDERRQLKLIPKTVAIYPKDSPDKIRASLERSGYTFEGEEAPVKKVVVPDDDTNDDWTEDDDDE